MKNFSFQVPTKIIFGKNTVKEIGKEAKLYGKKVLVIYGQGSIKRNNVYNIAIESLKKAGLEITEFSGVKSNPVISHVRAGIILARKSKVDFLIGIGGGSVIDETKAIAAGILHNGDVWDFFSGKSIVKKAMPVLDVLTIAATGSEMNAYSVITNEETRRKNGFISSYFYPKVSILDPTTTYSVPSNYTAYSSVDAICHLLEGYFTHKDNWAPIQDRYVEGLVKTIIEATELILKNPQSYKGRSTMMWAATLAWNGLSVAGVGKTTSPNHMLEHSLSAFYDIAHGAGLSIVLPAWMTYESIKENSKFVQFAENVFGIKTSDKNKTAADGIKAFKDWCQKIKSPVSFSEANLPITELEDLAENALETAKLWGIKGYVKKDIIDIYKLCL